jgi:hypothetical protein
MRQNQFLTATILLPISFMALAAATGATCSSPGAQPMNFSLPSATERPKPQVDVASLPLVLEPNLGQFNKEVKWLARGKGYTLFLTEHDATMVLREGDGSSSVVRMQLPGSKPWRNSQGEEPSGGVSNYIGGNDPAKWQTAIPHYRRVRHAGVYKGVDIVFYGNGGELEYDLIVEPRADPKQIRLAYDGVKSLELESPSGTLVLTTHSGARLRQERPRVYQEIDAQKVEVAGVYQILDRQQIGIQLAFYDVNRPLVIDPVLAYSTYLGGNGSDYGMSIAVDAQGQAYVTGTTQSTDFPAKSAYQSGLRGSSDVFVAKLNASGNDLVYSTFLGGAQSEEGRGIAVDPSGNAYVAGYTNSSNFPVMVASQPSFGGDTDAYVAKLDPNGALKYSTYLGGTGYDSAWAIAVDSTGTSWVTGRSNSVNFPATVGQNQLKGATDAFVVKLNSSGTRAWGTFIGGCKDDFGAGIAVLDGQAYVTGLTYSGDIAKKPFPYAKAAPCDCTLPSTCNADAFVTKLSSNGASLDYFTYLGGTQDDGAYAIAVDGAGAAFITGYTNSPEFPLVKANQTLKQGRDAFVTRLAADGKSIEFSTLLGGNLDDYGQGIAVDSSGTYVVGRTAGQFPVKKQIQANQKIGDAFVTKLLWNPAPGVLSYDYSTYLGGIGDDAAFGIAVGGGNAYVTGYTSSTNFPTKSPIHGDRPGMDAFVAKIGSSSGTVVPVPKGANLQSFINSAAPGITLTLEQGQIYYGPITLRSANTNVTIMTKGADTLVPEGQRATPAKAVKFAKIVTKDPAKAAITTEPGAHGFKLVGLEVFACTNPLPLGGRCPAGSGFAVLDQLINLVPTSSDIVLDRLYVHGDPAKGGRHGILLNSRQTNILNSYISDFKTENDLNDAQAIAGTLSTYDVTIQNNYLEGSSQSIMFGGGNVPSDQEIPTKIRILRNHFAKPLSWKGTKWAVKTLLELKYAKDVHIEGNVFDRTWVQSDQHGYAIVFTVKSQQKTSTFVKIKDVTFINNIVRDAGAGLQILGRDRTSDRDLGEVSNVLIRNNLFDAINGDLWGGVDETGKPAVGLGFGVSIKNGPKTVTVDHNTIIQTRGKGPVIDGGISPLRFLITGKATNNDPVGNLKAENLVFTNNIVHHGVSGISGDGVNMSTAAAAFAAYALGYTFLKNVVVGSSGGGYPNYNDNFFNPGDFSAVGFVDYIGRNYRLGQNSPYLFQGTDGKDVGADINLIIAKTAGVVLQ